MSTPFERTLQVAEHVYASLSARGKETCVIGGVAVAIHGHLRATKDLDLAIVTGQLREFAEALAAEGLAVEYRAPDDDDPVQGVVRIDVDGGDPVEIVNFSTTVLSRRQRLGLEAVRTARPLIEGSPLPVIDLPHLVALKLLANGMQDRADVAALLGEHDAATLAEVELVCERFELTEALARVRAESR